MLATVPYVHLQAAAFIGCCLASGALVGLVYSVVRMLRHG